jgi:2'-5' RNA ligase
VDSIEPHITLVYPLRLTVEEWPAQWVAFAACLEGFAPFRIEITRLNRFLLPARVLWLQPEDGGIITRIYRRLEERFPAYVEPPLAPFSFVPHMTVGFFDTLAALEEAQEKIASELTRLEFEVSEVAFAAQTAQGKWGRMDGIRLA